jgi:Domain of unknown function (DUF4263)
MRAVVAGGGIIGTIAIARHDCDSVNQRDDMFKDDLVSYLKKVYDLTKELAFPVLQNYSAILPRHSLPALAHRFARVSYCSDGAVVFYCNILDGPPDFALISAGDFPTQTMFERYNAIADQLVRFIDPASGMSFQGHVARFSPCEGASSMHMTILNQGHGDWMWFPPVSKVVFIGMRFFDVKKPTQSLEQIATATVEDALKDSASFLNTCIENDPWRVLSDFREMLDQGSTEECVQVFLAQHPYLVFPTLVRSVPKLKLGSEYVTDFMFENLGGFSIESWFVEIESPKKSIFTANGQLRAEVTQAFDQLVNWKQWITKNHAYLRTAVPDLSVNPRFLLVMGRERDVGEHRNKLSDLFHEPFSFMTYDALADRYEKILKRLVKTGLLMSAAEENVDGNVSAGSSGVM